MLEKVEALVYAITLKSSLGNFATELLAKEKSFSGKSHFSNWKTTEDLKHGSCGLSTSCCHLCTICYKTTGVAYVQVK